MKILVCFILILPTILNIHFINGQLIGSSCYTYYKESGLCVGIRKCKPIWKIITEGPRPLPDKLVEYIRNSQCGNPDDRNICCRPQDIEGSSYDPITTEKPIESTYTNLNSESGGFTEIQNHKNINLFDKNTCGPISHEKISNANDTHVFEYPWMALLGYDTGNGDTEYNCGGTLITKKYVLTAAHCLVISRSIRLTTVRLGEYDTSTHHDCELIEDEQVCAPPVQEIPVAASIPHSGYSKERYVHDVGLVRLSRAADITGFAVRPICLPISELLYRNSNQQKYIVTGWGNTERGFKSNKLLQAFLPAYPKDRCQETLSKINRRLQLGDGHFCAGGENNVDSCKGDSGGPVQYPANFFNFGTRYVQYGIVSFGPNACGDSNSNPGVYSSVQYYLKWILDNLSS